MTGHRRAWQRTLAGVGVAPLLIMLPSAAGAQLRPLDPLDWRAVAPETRVLAAVGLGAFSDHRASLAGEEGRLLELGNYLLIWRTGRVALEAAGTAVRSLRPDRSFAPPHGDATPGDGSVRRDAGDQRISTIVRLTPEGDPLTGVLRFGTRLPTTDNRVGLERDQTDFFALLGARFVHRGLALAAETGVGINGTRETHYEQSDVLVYTAGAEYALSHAALQLAITGHADGLRGRAVRGNEELAELRVGGRIGTARWLQLQLVRGLTEFSPGTGLLLLAGIRW
jgi:hypothetical protein